MPATADHPAAASSPPAVRVCPECGTLKPTAAFPSPGSSRCAACWNRLRAATTAHLRDTDETFRRRTNRYVKAWQAKVRTKLLTTAASKYRPYTWTEDAVLLDSALPHVQAATVLGRTLAGVTHRRKALAEIHGLTAPIRGHAANARKHPRATSCVDAA